jgi:hypothetical protein
MKFPVVAVLLRIAQALPAIVATVTADVKADKAATSDGGAKITPAEVGVIVGHIFEKLGAAVLPVVLKANDIATALASTM